MTKIPVQPSGGPVRCCRLWPASKTASSTIRARTINGCARPSPAWTTRRSTPLALDAACRQRFGCGTRRHRSIVRFRVPLMDRLRTLTRASRRPPRSKRRGAIARYGKLMKIRISVTRSLRTTKTICRWPILPLPSVHHRVTARGDRHAEAVTLRLTLSWREALPSRHGHKAEAALADW